MRNELHHTLTVLIVAAVALAPIVGVVAPPVAAASTTDVSIAPSSTNTSVGETVTFDIVVENASGGVAAWDGTVSLTNGDVANITNVTMQGDPANSSVTIGPDNNSVAFDAWGAETTTSGTATIATVTVETTGDGRTDLNLSMDALGDDVGASYTIDEQHGASLSVGTVASYGALSVNETAGTAPFTVNASATVENVGGAGGTITVPFTVDGETVDTTNVSLNAGESTVVSFEYEFTEHGQYDLAIGSAGPTTVDVNAAPTAVLAANTTAANVSEPVALNASGSTDLDGDELSYAWDVDGDGEFEEPTGEMVVIDYDTPGTYNVTVQVDDGNATDTDTVQITVSDVTDPTPAFIVDENDDGTADDPVELNATVTLNASDAGDNVAVDTYDWTVVDPSGETVTSLTNETAAFTPQRIGSYEVTLEVTDTAGNNASVTESFTVKDTTRPSVELTGPKQAIVNVTTTFDASGTTDNGEVVEYRWDFDGDGTNDTNTTTPTADWVYTDANQTYTVSVTAVDQSDNANTTSMTVETSRAPAIEITSPEDGAATNASEVAITYTTDNLDAGDAASVQYRVDGEGEWQDAGSINGDTLTLPDLSAGSHSVALRLVDSSDERLLPGVSATNATVTVTVDRESPSLSLVDPGQGDVEYGTDLNFSVADENLRNVTYRFTYSNGTTTGVRSLTAPYTVSTDGIPEGPTEVTVLARDEAGNVESGTFEFDFVSQPDITGLRPNGTVVNTTEPTVVAEYSDDDVAGDLGVNASAVTLTVNGERVNDTGAADTVLSTVVAPTLDDPGNGTVDLTLTVVDEAGHEATRNATFVVDAVAPSVGLDRNISERVSTNNAVAFTATSDDPRLEATWVNITRNGTTVRSNDVSGEVVSGATTVVWNGTDADGNAVDSGTYNVTIRSVDTVGNVRTVTKTVSVDNEPPTVTIDAVNSSSQTVTPPGGAVYVGDTVTVSGTANGTPGDAASVTVVANATFTNFRTTADVTLTGGTWNATFDASDFPDEGNYTIVARTTDPANNANSTNAGTTLRVDRTPPNLGATVSRENASTARVNLTVSERIDRETLNVTVVLGNGTPQTVSMTERGDEYTGTFTLSQNGTQYYVNASAADPAGNWGTDDAFATMVTANTTNKQVTVLSERTGTFVRFNTTAEVNSTFITLTASDAPLRPLTSDLVGASFLNGQLGQNLTTNLDNATIGIPVTEDAVPAGVSPSEVTIRRYNESTGTWTNIPTDVEQVELNDGTNGTYWVATVEHFSTYGAVAVDNEPPSLLDSGPSGNLEYGDTDAEVRFEYADDLSSVDTSAVDVYFDGEKVTGSDAASITGSYATYDASDLTPGESYTATVRVTDDAGNSKNYTTTFTVVEDTNPPSIDSITPGDGAQFDASTDEVTLNVDYSDDVSGVNTDRLKLFFDGSEVTGDADIGSSGLSYTATGLSSNSTHTLRVVVVDAAGNDPVERSVSFEINASKQSGGGGGSTGGGGGGGGGGSSGEEASVSLTEVASGATISVRDAPTGATVTQDLGGSISSDRMTLQSVTVDLTFANDQFRLELSNPSAGPQGAPELSEATGISYFQVDSFQLPDSDVDTVTFEFQVEPSALPEGASMDDVALYRYTGDSWEALDTTHEGDGVFTANSPGFSAFAVGVQSGADATATATPSSTETPGATETATPSGTDTPSTTAPDDGPSETQTDVSTPGFGPIVALLAVLLSALLLRRE